MTNDPIMSLFIHQMSPLWDLFPVKRPLTLTHHGSGHAFKPKGGVNNVASQCGCICKGEYEVEPVAFFAFSCLLWHSNHEITPGPHVKALFFRHMCFFAKNAPEKSEQLNNGWANISWSIWGKLGERACEIHICNQCVHKK